MNYFVNFQVNGSLFKCDMNKFNDTIKSVLTNMISIRANKCHLCTFYHYDDMFTTR